MKPFPYHLGKKISLIFQFFLAYLLSNLLSKTQILFFTESYFEVELVNRLQGVIDKQRGQIKKFEQSNIEYKADNEEVRGTVQNFEKRIASSLSIHKKLWLILDIFPPNRIFFVDQGGAIWGDLVKISCGFSCMEREVVAGNSN